MNIETQTFFNAAGDKVGVAVWSGERDGRNMMVNWEVFDMSDHSLGVVRYMTGARDLLEGSCRTNVEVNHPLSAAVAARFLGDVEFAFTHDARRRVDIRNDAEVNERHDHIDDLIDAPAWMLDAYGVATKGRDDSDDIALTIIDEAFAICRRIGYANAAAPDLFETVVQVAPHLEAEAYEAKMDGDADRLVHMLAPLTFFRCEACGVACHADDLQGTDSLPRCPDCNVFTPAFTSTDR